MSRTMKKGDTWHEYGTPNCGWTHYVHKVTLIVMYLGGGLFIGSLNDVHGSYEIKPHVYKNCILENKKCLLIDGRL